MTRVRKRPAWMQDYVVTEIDKDVITHFTLFANCDPTNFESAIKEAK